MDPDTIDSLLLALCALSDTFASGDDFGGFGMGFDIVLFVVGNLLFQDFEATGSSDETKEGR